MQTAGEKTPACPFPGSRINRQQALGIQGRLTVIPTLVWLKRRGATVEVILFPQPRPALQVREPRASLTR